MILNSLRLILKFNNSYCGIFLYASKYKFHVEALNGGNIPLTTPTL